ncbi:flagellar hook-basal body protein [Peribacillus huizhouensis]|uniref:Flagellar basal-body rod protein FlgG n=1 Tax=Peribacillus huizhouensis TaxID=1501239 RepID=A0ABR6CS44_9BACI|nr:flagellar hook-basal body protein [Peribacillus huizhouensis]MBA9027857.1 flagellar basal-body rod protein FlgG [Peribacillus huizhouensis]
MFRGFYTAASGMLTQQRRAEMLTNNLSNANTPGFKTDQASVRSFPEMLMQRMGQQATTPNGNISLPIHSQLGTLSTGVYMQEATPLYKQGDIQETELSTDLAIVNGNLPLNQESGKPGSLLFIIENSEGEARYTRNGNFTLDGAGYLTTANGNYVLDDNSSRIRLNSENFSINEDGMIVENNQTVARVGIAFARDPFGLIKEGDGLFRTEGAMLASAYNTAGVSFNLKQGYLEGSNVDQAQTMTDMLTAYRTFEANQKILQAYDKSMDKAVNEIGRL